MNKLVLSKPEILRHIDNGNIVIEPLDEKHINTSSVDITLGEWYFREENPGHGDRLFNVYDKKDVSRVWGNPIIAPKKDLLLGKQNQVIILAPGETILGHTNEFIGGRNCITTNMHARSSLGRVFISVCKCAGWGDVGFINRWTMEITNFSTHYHIPLVVGMRVGQIVFHEVEPLDEDYSDTGKYQTGTNIDELREKWKPEMMLPRLYDDLEIQN